MEASQDKVISGTSTRLWRKLFAYLVAFGIMTVFYQVFVLPDDQPLGQWLKPRGFFALFAGAILGGFSCGRADFLEDALWKAKKRRSGAEGTD